MAKRERIASNLYFRLMAPTPDARQAAADRLRRDVDRVLSRKAKRRQGDEP